MHRISAIVCAVLVAASLALAGASAEKLDELWGSNITVRQLLSRVAPELIGSFPRESHDQPVHWGADRGRAVYEGPEQMAARVPPIDWQFARGCLQVDVYAFEFIGWNATSMAVPYSRVVVYLQEDYGHKDSDQSVGYNTSFELAFDVNTNCHGLIYRAVGYHWLTFPPGYSPPGMFTVGYTYWVTRWE